MKQYLVPSEHHEAHSFSPAVAAGLSIEKAIILKDLYGLCKYKLANGLLNNNIPFCYYSSRAMSIKYPYIPASSIRRYLSELESDGYLISIVSNKMKIDVTKSYFVNFKMYDDLTLGVKWSESDVSDWQKWAFGQLEITIAQNEQPIDQSITMGDRNEQGSDRNEQAITLSTGTQQEEGICPAIAEPPTHLELPEPLKEKKNVRDSDELAAAVRIVSYLNEKARRNFSVGDKISKSYLNVIIARLRDGITEEQMKLVIDNRCSAWLGDATMSEYLRPNTLFTPKNIANYLEAATRSGVGVSAESLLDEPLNDEARYKNWDLKMKRDYPKTATEVRFFKASEFNAFFTEHPEWCPVIWRKWSPDLLQKKFKTALRLLEDSQSKAKLAPDGLCSYLKQWFIDERDGKH